MTGLSFMGFIALLLLGSGVLATLVGWVMVLIPAFRQHIAWGLASLLVPGAAIVFALTHWGTARRGFLLQLMGAVVLVVGTLAANDIRSPQLADAVSGVGGPNSAVLESSLKAKETEVRIAEQQLNSLQTKLNREYEALKARRAKLGTDAAALTAFNQDAAVYGQAKMQLSIQAGRLAQLRAEQVRLTDQVFLQARELAKQNPRLAPLAAEPPPLRAATPRPVTVGPGDIVMYTTKRCPACIAAKQYLVRRGAAYREVDVDYDRNGWAEFQKRGGRGVPLIVVKGQQMEGFNEIELEKLL